ncbi:MAG: hypothetical protein V1850_01465 [Candidatus Bathyarchaeota archaeon]
MVEKNESMLKNLKDIQSLRDLLKSEMSINGPEEGEVIARIKVYNDAPTSPDGGDIVFLGVGLRIIDGRGTTRGSNYWPSKMNKSRTSDRIELRQKYNEGTWVGGREGSFPVVTSDEQAHGEVLFPGESVVYEIKTTKTDLPYLDIRVEGSVSRRHLFHISLPVEALKALTQPLVVETFRALDTIDFYKPLLSLINVMPSLGPQTTLADIEAFKGTVEKARDHVEEVMKELNKVYHSAPNQKLRDYMKKGIGQYLTAVTQVCNSTLKALSGSDTKKMQEAAEEMKAHLLKAEEVKRRQTELMSQFGIDS